jgi:hypothetical protein
MNNAPAILRSLVTFAVIVPLAVLIGYLLANPLDTSTFTYVGILTAILMFPVLLRWHHPLLIFSWNSGMFLFFLPGRPDAWLAMTAVSLGITLLQRALGGVKQLVSVPQVTWSLICLIGVVVLTARLTGMGLHAFGDEVSGGRRYIYLLGAIMGYFALSSRRIPPERAGLYVALFFLPGLMAFISDLWSVMPGPLHFIYWFFPARESTLSMNPLEKSLRLYGGMMVAITVFSYMQARYGIRGIFLSHKPWRWMILLIVSVYGLLGGFRSGIMGIALPFILQFVIEGLHRTKLLIIFAFVGVLGATALIPLASHLPSTAQRALSFLPLNIDPAVRRDAEESSDMRFDMWKALLPEVPQYLLLGKGYAISRKDIDLLTGTDATIHATAGFEQNQYLAVAGSYHSGPFSVVMTFGIWGVIAVVWFWIAGIWVLRRNYRYGDPALRTVNTFLLAAFVARIIFFIFIFGDMGSDMTYFSGWLGLSVALNGGICHPAPEPARATKKFQAVDDIRPHLQPPFQRPKI